MATTTAADGATLSYEVVGDDVFSDVIVLVHGITECSATWDPVVNRLAPGRNVVTVDLRGHGASERKPPYDVFTMANDLHSVIEELGADDALMVGHSLGGMVVSAYAAAGYPARGVVNVDQPLETTGFKAALATIEPLLRGTPEEFETTLDQAFALMYEPLPAAEQARVKATESREQPVVLGVWELVFATSTEDLAAVSDTFAKSIKLPYLSLHGSVVPGYEEWLRQRMPDLSYEVWPDHGHFPHLVDPDRFVARIEAFGEDCS